MLRQESVISHYRDSLHKAQILQESFDQYHVYNYVYCTCRQALTGSERSKVIRPQIEWRTLKRTLPDARAKTKCASELFVSWNFVLLGRQRRIGGRKTAELRWSRRLCGEIWKHLYIAYSLYTNCIHVALRCNANGISSLYLSITALL